MVGNGHKDACDRSSTKALCLGQRAPIPSHCEQWRKQSHVKFSFKERLFVSGRIDVDYYRMASLKRLYKERNDGENNALSHLFIIPYRSIDFVGENNNNPFVKMKRNCTRLGGV